MQYNILQGTNQLFPIWKCDFCHKMRSLDKLEVSQRKKRLKKMRCIHSKVATTLAGERWQDRWPSLPLGDIRLIKYIPDLCRPC